MPKINVLKTFQRAELEAVHRCELELNDCRAAVEAIRERIAANDRTEQSARAQLTLAKERARFPADLAAMDAGLKSVEEAERAIQAAERERGPLRHLLENAEREARMFLESLRDARRSLFQAEFEDRKATLKSELPALERLLEAFGCWWQSGGNAPDGQLWAAFLRDLVGHQPRECLEAAYEHAPKLFGLK